jgi:hypothetical protein
MLKLRHLGRCWTISMMRGIAISAWRRGFSEKASSFLST